ncbi:hypothetical protein [Kordiimonas marina]|uniref:hypothetical protein n=1 Tax=Kordiimonas marina TaxID=2872312 RepID=UPI001FF5721E|nr:hypothetical protein [Kordiimonas marina]MCJ9428574.1 hypothetical protein [Kordiimonas marina]
MANPTVAKLNSPELRRVAVQLDQLDDQVGAGIIRQCDIQAALRRIGALLPAAEEALKDRCHA